MNNLSFITNAFPRRYTKYTRVHISRTAQHRRIRALIINHNIYALCKGSEGLDGLYYIVTGKRYTLYRYAVCYLQYDTTAALCSRHYDHVRSACDVYSTGGDSNERFGIYFFFVFSNETLGRVGSAACRRHARRFVVFVFQKPRRSFHIRFDWFEVNNLTRLQYATALLSRIRTMMCI